MRTRFLNVDHFNSAPIQSLEFLCVPLPQLPSLDLHSLRDLICFDDLSAFTNSLDIEKLPIDDALFKFFSDALPHPIDVNIVDFTVPWRCSQNAVPDDHRIHISQQIIDVPSSEDEAEVLCEKKGLKNRRHISSEIVEVELEKEDIVHDEAVLGMVPFEIPELDLSLEDGYFSARNKMPNFFEILDTEITADMVTLEGSMKHFFDFQTSLYSVDAISPEYRSEQKNDLLDESVLFEGQIHSHPCMFPLLEVDDTNLDICSTISMDNELLIKNIELQEWTQKDKANVNNRELCGSVELDILEYPSVHCPVKQCLEAKLLCPAILEIDFISLIEGSHIEESSVLHGGRVDDDSIWSVFSILFEDFQFLDLDLSLFFDIFSNLVIINEAETFDQTFGQAINFRTFNEIVSHELILPDDSFKLLPIPIFSEHWKTTSLYVFVEELLAELKPQPSSTSDGIYLDWYLLEEDSCYFAKYLSRLTMLENIDSYSINSFLNSSEPEVLIYDFVSSGESPLVPKKVENREILNILPGCCFAADLLVDEVASSKLPNDRCIREVDGEALSDNNSEKVSLFFGSMSQFSDLDFFLNSSECSAGKNNKPANEGTDTNASFPAVSSGDSIAAMQLRQWNYKFCPVKLSDDIQTLIDELRMSYLTVFKNDTQLRNSTSSFLVTDDIALLTLSKEKLMVCLKNTSASKTSSAPIDDNRIAFVTLCAIKQMAWYLCYYGVHTTYLYVDKLCRSVQCLNLRLGFLRNLIEDAHEKAKKETPKFHPSLSVIHKIVESKFSQGCQKVLIVAELVFWWPLKRLLTSMKISYNELKNTPLREEERDVSYEPIDTTIEAALHSDCCLMSHEYISPSFPFNKFAVILEYGGSSGSSKVSTISPKLDGFPPLYFLKVEVEESSVSRALCEGVNMPKEIRYRMRGDAQSFTTLEENKKLEELLNYIPVDENYGIGSMEAADEVGACCMPSPDPCVGLAMESDQIERSMASFPNNVIIVNTHNFDQEMIISRRSTYQKILAMEKEGIQVVERDFNLPVDVIVSAAVCLAWYDWRNISKKATTPKEASSPLPLCVENIAANILTLLSFTFNGCILVFEGESDFLTGIMESSDELYAAAASLGISLQLFCSYSCEMTDEIIVSCINFATKLTRGLFPKMPESETLAESFLTMFPSINPLSAHAILSSGCTLLEFLKWSRERRIYVVQKYQVFDGSITLLSALCRYGEREDSKSGMTDCSSVSSAPDSENCPRRSDLGKRKQKSVESPQKIDKTICHVEPLKLFMDGGLMLPKASQPYNCRMSKNLEIFDELGKPGLSCSDNLFGKKQGLDTNMIKNPFVVPQLHDPKMSTDEISDSIKRQSSSLDDLCFDQNQGVDKATRNNLARHKDNFGDLHEDFTGEVIDIDDSSALNKNSFFNSTAFSLLVPEMHKDSGMGTSRIARRLSFGTSCSRTFPMDAEINHVSDAWISVGDWEQSLRDGIRQHPGTYFKDKTMPPKILEEAVMQKSVENVHKLSLEKDVPNYGKTIFSNAIHSAQPQEGSPWTIEFLNRIREKSRLRQQSLPCDLSSPSLRYCADVLKITKRRSPSILDFYKYQGGCMPKKNVGQKRKKHSIQPSSSSKNNKTSASFLSTWTPIDKRARQTLSFATNGSRGQSKLVWSDKDVHS